MFLKILSGIVILLLGSVYLQMTGCATTSVSKSSIEEEWGIEVESIRLTAGGNMLDFRYRIIDPDKAMPLVDRRNKPYLVDQESGAKFSVPSPVKLGPLRATTRHGKPKAGRTYFILFSNPGGFVKSGSKVSVVVGDFRAENLTVE